MRPAFAAVADKCMLYMHKPAGRRGRTLDGATERFCGC